MANGILNKDVKGKIVTFLTSKGKNVENLNETQLNDLYWSVLNEVTTDTTKTFGDEDEPKEITKAIGDADDEDVTYNDDGTITVKEDEIIKAVKENQNPVMSKSELIREMRSQIINEDNKYQDEYDSGDNDYSRHLDSESVRNMAAELYNDIRSAAEEKFGGEANFDRASQEMARSLQNILMFEQNKKQELSEEAIELIREEYPALTEDAVDIDAEITGHPQLGGRDITKGNVQYERGTTAPPEGHTEEELKNEVTKRRIINGMTHGAARKGQNLYHMASDKLRGISPNATQDYSKVMAANDFLYWAMDKNTIKQQSSGGVHAGNVRVVIQESGKPKIVAQGMTFSFLLHELTKGVYELQSLHGRHENYEIHKYVTDKTDTLEAEPDDIRLGTGIWEKISRFIDIENANHKSLFYHKLITRNADDFVEIMKGLMSGNRDMVAKVQEIADEASAELRQEEYDDAMGTYDDKPKETPPTEDDDFPDPDNEGGESQYSDPELERLLGGSSQEEPQETNGEPDYGNMSRGELQDLMDDALDTGDFGLAAKIGPHLH